jgi:hypothetical protein
MIESESDFERLKKSNYAAEIFTHFKIEDTSSNYKSMKVYSHSLLIKFNHMTESMTDG